jgi:uncharacterized glyoxalase superfamily protein PhnB
VRHGEDMTQTQTTSQSAAHLAVWHSMAFEDAEAMIGWLRAVGFTELATYRDEADASVVVHAEWGWPGPDGGLGGGIMFGSLRAGGAVDNAGRSAAYLVSEDPDGVVARAVEAGGTLVREVVDNDYGGRGGTVEDPEGNHWSVGSYRPR